MTSVHAKQAAPQSAEESRAEARRNSVSSEDSFEDFTLLRRARGYRPCRYPISAGDIALTGREIGQHRQEFSSDEEGKGRSVDPSGSELDVERKHIWCCDEGCDRCGFLTAGQHRGYRAWLVRRAMYGRHHVQDRVDFQTASTTEPKYLCRTGERAKGVQGFWSPTNTHSRTALGFSDLYKKSFREPSRAPIPSAPYSRRIKSSLQYDPNPPSVNRTNLNEHAAYGAGYRPFFQKLDSRVARYDPLQRMLQGAKATEGPATIPTLTVFPISAPAAVRDVSRPHSATGTLAPAPREEWHRW